MDTVNGHYLEVRDNIKSTAYLTHLPDKRVTVSDCQRTSGNGLIADIVGNLVIRVEEDLGVQGRLEKHLRSELNKRVDCLIVTRIKK